MTMRNMSFALTTDQVLRRQKWVTRRFGWAFLVPGDLVQPVVKAMGLRKSESVEKIGGPICIVETRWEPLNAITPEDVVLEGFPGMSPAEFVEMLVKHYRLRNSAKPVNRIEFGYTEERTEPGRDE